jgi:GT2 family glycosyltransferase
VLSPVSIVIPTWNGRHLLETFLPSVIEAAAAYTTHAAIEVVVVDDGSTDGTAEWLATQAAPVPLRAVRLEPNAGFGRACNRGVEEARHPLVYLVNNDVEMTREVLPLLARAFEEGTEELFAVHTRMRDLQTDRDVGTGKMGGFSRGFLRVHQSYVPAGQPKGPFWSMFATGGSAMFHRGRYLELGGFDPLFAPFYFEDVELSYRAWKRGLSVAYEPAAVVSHKFSSTIGSLHDARVAAISHRNRLILHWIHLHDRGYLSAHLLWLAILTVGAPLTFRFSFLQGLWEATKALGAIDGRRREERRRAVRTDRQVLGVFNEMKAAGTVRAYDDPRELDVPFAAAPSGRSDTR